MLVDAKRRSQRSQNNSEKKNKKQTKTFYLNLKNKQTKNTGKQRETASFSPL